VGQHFARIQLEIAVNRLLAKLTNFRIDEGTTVSEVAGISIGAPEKMYLEFDLVSTSVPATAAAGTE
jgi:cytochrome P450